MRDVIICTLIGFQNEQGNDINSEEYKAYQKLMDFIELHYGALHQT